MGHIFWPVGSSSGRDLKSLEGRRDKSTGESTGLSSFSHSKDSGLNYNNIFDTLWQQLFLY